MDTAAQLLGLEHKDFDFELKELDEEGVFEGHAAVYGNVDLGGDLLERGALTKTVQERPRVSLLWHHDPHEPIGVALLSEDGKGLAVKGQLTMRVQRAQEAHALMKDGALGGLSIGYRAVKKNISGRVRYLKEIAVREVSPVTFPMNELATVGGVKSAELVGLLSGVLRRLREDDPEAVKALLAELEPGTGPLDSGQAADLDDEPDIATRLRDVQTRMREVIR